MVTAARLARIRLCVVHEHALQAMDAWHLAASRRKHQMSALLASCIVARTTLDIDAFILGELRRRGERERKSMGQVASELLATALAESRQRIAAPNFSWMSADLGAPRVNVEDKEALRRVLDQRP